MERHSPSPPGSPAALSIADLSLSYTPVAAERCFDLANLLATLSCNLPGRLVPGTSRSTA